MSVAHQFTVNVIAQGLARMLSIASNLVLILVVARMMGTEAFGGFSYVLAFTSIAVALADLGTTAVLARGLAHHVEEERSAYLGNFLTLRLVLVGVVALGALAVALAWPHDLLYALLIIAIGLPVMASRFFEPIYQVYGRPWLSLWSNMVFGVTQLLLAGLVWAYPNMDVTRLTAGFVVSNLAYTIVALGMMLRLVRPRLRADRSLLKAIVLVAAPLGVGSIFTTVISRADVIILEHLRTSSEVGLYSAAYRILDLAVFLAITLVTPLIPILSREIVEDPRRALERCRLFMQVAGVCALPVAIVVPSVAEELLALILGQAYVPAAGALSILVWNFVLIVLTLLGSTINLANGEVRHGYWNTPLAAVVNLGLNFWLIPRYGIEGAAWSALGGQISMMLVSQYYTLARFGRVYDLHVWMRIALACAAMALTLLLTRGLGPWPSAALSLILYATLVIRLRLFPRQILEALRKARADRASSA